LKEAEDCLKSTRCGVEYVLYAGMKNFRCLTEQENFEVILRYLHVLLDGLLPAVYTVGVVPKHTHFDTAIDIYFSSHVDITRDFNIVSL
jgi:hypothetical protein